MSKIIRYEVNEEWRTPVLLKRVILFSSLFVKEMLDNPLSAGELGNFQFSVDLNYGLFISSEA